MDQALHLSRSERVVAEALSWIGTPFHHAADVKGPRGGVDCAMLVMRVFVDTGVLQPFDPRPYPSYFYMHSSEPKYLDWVEKFGSKVDEPEPGDLALFQFGKAISHGGIMIGEDKMVHAYELAGRVEASEISRSPLLAKRLRGYWRFNG